MSENVIDSQAVPAREARAPDGSYNPEYMHQRFENATAEVPAIRELRPIFQDSVAQFTERVGQLPTSINPYDKELSSAYISNGVTISKSNIDTSLFTYSQIDEKKAGIEIKIPNNSTNKIDQLTITDSMGEPQDIVLSVRLINQHLDPDTEHITSEIPDDSTFIPETRYIVTKSGEIRKFVTLPKGVVDDRDDARWNHPSKPDRMWKISKSKIVASPTTAHDYQLLKYYLDNITTSQQFHLNPNTGRNITGEEITDILRRSLSRTSKLTPATGVEPVREPKIPADTGISYIDLNGEKSDASRPSTYDTETNALGKKEEQAENPTLTPEESLLVKEATNGVVNADQLPIEVKGQLRKVFDQVSTRVQEIKKSLKPIKAETATEDGKVLTPEVLARRNIDILSDAVKKGIIATTIAARVTGSSLLYNTLTDPLNITPIDTRPVATPTFQDEEAMFGRSHDITAEQIAQARNQPWTEPPVVLTEEPLLTPRTVPQVTEPPAQMPYDERTDIAKPQETRPPESDVQEYEVKPGDTNRIIAERMVKQALEKNPELSGKVDPNILAAVVSYYNSSINNEPNPNKLNLGPLNQLSIPGIVKIAKKYDKIEESKIGRAFANREVNTTQQIIDASQAVKTLVDSMQ